MIVGEGGGRGGALRALFSALRALWGNLLKLATTKCRKPQKQVQGIRRRASTARLDELFKAHFEHERTQPASPIAF